MPGRMQEAPIQAMRGEGGSGGNPNIPYLNCVRRLGPLSQSEPVVSALIVISLEAVPPGQSQSASDWPRGGGGASTSVLASTGVCAHDLKMAAPY